MNFATNGKVKAVLSALLLSCAAATTVSAAVLVNEAHLVTANDSVASTMPAEKVFDVIAAGDYTLTLTDVGKQATGANAFTSLSVVIYQGSQFVKQLKVPLASASNSVTVTLGVGQYRAQVLGTTFGASLYSLTINNSTVTPLSMAGAITAASSTNSTDDFSKLDVSLNLVSGHSYSITLQDIAFPAALDSLQSTVISDGTNLQCPLTATSTDCTFVAGSTNKLVALASKSPVAVAGMYRIKIIDVTSNIVTLASVYPVGAMPAPVAIPLPKTTSYQLLTTDIGTPDPLNSLQVLLLQDSNVLANQNATGMPAASVFNASAGSANLYVIGSATSNGGIYATQILQNGVSVYSKATVITPSAAPTQTGYYFNATLPAAGNYVLSLSDLNFPQSFSKLTANVTQAGASVGSMTAAGTLSINNAAAGAVQVFVIATPNASGQGLFGLTLNATGSTNKLISLTQGVGGSFVTIPVTVATAGSYKLSVTDMQAPQQLGQLLVAVTRDTQFVGEVIGSATVNVDATPGDYVFNVIANPAAGANASFGIYGIAFGNAPSINFTASATSVTSSSNVTLNWSSTDAASCSATDAWSGIKSASGSESFGPVLTDSKLTLTCAGITGSVSKSVTVQVKAAGSEAPPAKSGGGGALQWWMLGALLMLVGSRRLFRQQMS